MSDEREVAEGVTFNGSWYTVTTPTGLTWSFEEEDRNEAYIEQSLWAWSRWLDYVKGDADVS